MHVKITRGAGWYSDKVGEIFGVYEGYARDSDKTVYFIDSPDHSTLRYISPENCEVIEEAAGNDAVHSPQHYTAGRFETIEMIEEIAGGYSDGFLGHCVGTATKYLARAPYKHDSPTEDLRKAAKYIEWAAERAEKLEKRADSD